MPRTFYLIFLSQGCANGCIWAVQDKLVFHTARWISGADMSDAKLAPSLSESRRRQNGFFDRRSSLLCSPDAEGRLRARYKIQLAENSSDTMCPVLVLCPSSRIFRGSKQKTRGNNAWPLSRWLVCVLGSLSHPFPLMRHNSPPCQEFTLFSLLLMSCVLYITVKTRDIWRTEKGH